ncbi:MAG: SBBP repeat-containing protein, partial [Actinomycetota bacterium]
AMGADGSVFVTGFTDSTDFPTTGSGAAQGGGDAFVTKLSPDGSTVLFSTYLGGSGADAGRGIGVDAAGRVTVSGATDSEDFPTTGGFQPNLGGGSDGFVVRLSSNGANLEFGTYLGGSGNDGATRLTLDPDSNVYLTGYTNSVNFPVSEFAMQPEFSGDYDAFVTKISAAGAVEFSTYLGGRDGDSGAGIAVDFDRSVYVGGSTDSGDFPIGPESFTDTFQGGRFGDAFVTKLSASGSTRVYSTYVGGSGSDQGADIAVDLDGYCYITGTTNSNDLMLASPTIQPFQGSLPGGLSDIFVHKILPDGSFIVYTTYLGSSGEDVARAIEVDEDRNPHTKAYILGETDSAEFPLQDSLQSNHGGNSDLFLTKLHENVFLVEPMVVLDYSTYLGGGGLDHAGDLAVDAIGNAAITGDTVSADFPQHQGPNAPAAKSKKKKKKRPVGSVQGFVAKVFDGVAEPGGILQAPKRLSFGRVRTDRFKTKAVVIANTSRSTRLAITVETPQAPLTIGKGIQSAFIEPGGKFTVNLTFAPTAVGTFNGALVIRSSDPARPVVNLPVIGAGRTVVTTPVP